MRALLCARLDPVLHQKRARPRRVQCHGAARRAEQLTRVIDHDRLAMRRTNDGAKHVVVRVPEHGSDCHRELARLARHLVPAEARPARDLRHHTASSTSPGFRAVSKAAVMKSRAGMRREALPLVTMQIAPRAGRALTQSAAGSAWQRLPPMVPRLRTAR